MRNDKDNNDEKNRIMYEQLSWRANAFRKELLLACRHKLSHKQNLKGSRKMFNFNVIDTVVIKCLVV